MSEAPRLNELFAVTVTEEAVDTTIFVIVAVYGLATNASVNTEFICTTTEESVGIDVTYPWTLLSWYAPNKAGIINLMS